ncbi:MAG: DUF2254 domain-containing protein [Alphaproteobacteria bacterium]|nr:DUF2254 domain-containing protein [Alphaproteobacteria bacterium]
MSRAQWLLRQLTSQLWLRALAFSGVGIAAALVAYLLRDQLPDHLDAKFGADSVSSILHILANSMLAVTTFSLGIMVSAFASAASTATPRTTQLLRADSVSQTVLSIFIGAFLFSIVGIIALQAGLYGLNGRIILFILTIVVILIVVAALLVWIEHLSHFGLLADTMKLVEHAAAKSIADRLRRPYLGASRHPGHLPDGPVTPVQVDRIGHVQNIDLPRLAELAEDIHMAIYVEMLPGTFNDSVVPAAHVAGQIKAETAAAISRAFQIGDDRSFDQDPRLGCIVLSEIASRALSPAVNDPGTAIAIINRSVSILAPWMRRESATGGETETQYANVFVPALSTRELLDDIFTPIARDGAAVIEVQIALQKALASLADISGGATVTTLAEMAQHSFDRAMDALPAEIDRDRLRKHQLVAHKKS